METQKPIKSSAGSWAFIVVYAASFAWMYVESTQEITSEFSEQEERSFRVAAVKTGTAAGPRQYVSVTLMQLRKPGLDLSQISFLLPDKVVVIPGGDLHRATVLEDHSKWQLIEYDFGNTHSSVSRYRAFQDRIEPVSYRVTFHPGIVIAGFLLLVPAFLAAAIAKWIAKIVARKKQESTDVR